MKKVLCGFAFGLVLMVAGAQAWADGISFPPPNPKLTLRGRLVFSDGIPIPPPNPRFGLTVSAR
jgi:hypothetical protein